MSTHNYHSDTLALTRCCIVARTAVWWVVGRHIGRTVMPYHQNCRIAYASCPIGWVCFSLRRRPRQKCLYYKSKTPTNHILYNSSTTIQGCLLQLLPLQRSTNPQRAWSTVIAESNTKVLCDVYIRACASSSCLPRLHTLHRTSRIEGDLPARPPLLLLQRPSAENLRDSSLHASLDH